MSELLVIDTTKPGDLNFNHVLTSCLGEFSRDLGLTQVVIGHEEAADSLARIQAAHSVVLAGVPVTYPFKSAERLQPTLRRWIYDVDVPTLGICLGEQAIGLAFGGDIIRKKEVELGETTADIRKKHRKDPLFKEMERSFRIMSLHRASISIKEARLLRRLASSGPKESVSTTGCRNQIVRVKGKPIYGVQFHPEHTEDGKQLLKNFLVLPRDH